MKEYDFIIVTPCFNESHTVIAFLHKLDETLRPSGLSFLVVVVDDGSTDNTSELLKRFEFSSPQLTLKRVRLKYNVGHQKAIYQGLLYSQGFASDKFIVMDSDGEDDPRAILELIAIENADIVFVTRGRRHESIRFKLGYFFYKVLFALVAQTRINFGNYSMINRKALDAVIGHSFVHYSAFLSRLKLSRHDIRYDRQKRLDGQSKMNFHSLVLHGLKAMIEYSDRVLIFFIKFFVIVLFALIGVGGYILYAKLFTGDAITGWASTLGTSLFNACLIILGIIVLGLLLLNLNERSKFHDNIVVDN